MVEFRTPRSGDYVIVAVDVPHHAAGELFGSVPYEDDRAAVFSSREDARQFADSVLLDSERWEVRKADER